MSADEVQRAGRFHFDLDRKRFIAARGVLRFLLGSYLQTSPKSLQFAYEPYGKPYLTSPSSPSVAFNLSHSGDLALFAFGLKRNIGVDLERIRLDFGGEDIARRFFSPQETSALLSLQPSDRPNGFFNCWTRKEAYVKARADGLQVPLDTFEVSIDPTNAEASFLNGVAPEWWLKAFSPEPEYAGALVSDGSKARIQFFQYVP